MKIQIALAVSILLGVAVIAPNVEARGKAGLNPTQKVTVTDRESILDQKIEEAFKANQLTVKEADGLRDKMKQIREKEQSMKDKNGGRLSYENNTALEKSLNKVSEKLQKVQLQKRVQ